MLDAEAQSIGSRFAGQNDNRFLELVQISAVFRGRAHVDRFSAKLSRFPDAAFNVLDGYAAGLRRRIAQSAARRHQMVGGQALDVYRDSAGEPAQLGCEAGINVDAVDTDSARACGPPRRAVRANPTNMPKRPVGYLQPFR